MTLPPGKHVVVVDGSNLATEGRTTPSLHQLDEAVRSYAAENPGAEIVVVVDASFEHRIDPSERKQLVDAELHGEVVSPPAGAIGRGDAFVLRIAERTGAVVLSNDSFQEFHAEHPWLFDSGRLVGGKPVPGVGWIFTPRIPVRGPKSRHAQGKAKSGDVRALSPPVKAAELAKAAKKVAARRAPLLPDGSTPKVGDVWPGTTGEGAPSVPAVTAKKKTAIEEIVADGTKKAAAKKAATKKAAATKAAATKAAPAKVAPAKAAPAKVAAKKAAEPSGKKVAAAKVAAKKVAPAATKAAPAKAAAAGKKAAPPKVAPEGKKAAAAKVAAKKAAEPSGKKVAGAKVAAKKVAPAGKKAAPAKAAAAGKKAAAAGKKAAAAGKKAAPAKVAAKKAAEPSGKKVAAKKVAPEKAAPEKVAAKKVAAKKAATPEKVAAKKKAQPAAKKKAATKAVPKKAASKKAALVPVTTTNGAAEAGAARSTAATNPAVREAIGQALAEAIAPAREPAGDGPESLGDQGRGKRKAKDGRHRRRRSAAPPPAVNEPLAFITFVATYPLERELEGQVVSFTSHGAMVDVDLPGGGVLHSYIPLAALGDPPPSKARQVLTRGERRRFVLVALDPPRRVAELALPELVAGRTRSGR